MAKSRFSRFRFQIRRNELICIGQSRTMRGVSYDAKRVYVPLADTSVAAFKKGMQDGIALLEEVS